ncbi:MAG: Rdx family protein [Deltaproteobacteria bacterium]|nr:Rdx family protein [Deltaproteobacteria bacterium]
MKAHNGAEPKIIPGATGEFTVTADGRKLWDKFKSGRFPEHDEITSQL